MVPMLLLNERFDGEYERGRIAGRDWADANLFQAAESPPFTPDCADTPYNVGALHGVIEALRRMADALCRAPIDSLMKTVSRELGNLSES